jgi:hypothetical protein
MDRKKCHDKSVLVDNNSRTVISEEFSKFEEQLSVQPNVETTILTYTNVQAFYLYKIVCTGTADAKFALKTNGTTIAVLRNSWNNRNVTFDFSDKSIYCAARTIVSITAIHTEVSDQTYEANLQGFVYTIT